MNGEILGFTISLFCIFCTIIFVPSALVWAICTKDELKIESQEFKERWESLFEFLNIKTNIAKLYTFIYIMRRLIFVILCIYYN